MVKHLPWSRYDKSSAEAAGGIQCHDTILTFLLAAALLQHSAVQTQT